VLTSHKEGHWSIMRSSVKRYRSKTGMLYISSQSLNSDLVDRARPEAALGMH
jgi:hypothetical protein